MYSAEVLSQLRSLNWLMKEMKSLPSGSPELVHLNTQMDTLRARLPNSILSYHDRLVKRGQASTVEVSGSNCSACHLKLPQGLISELRMPGRFGVCPNCGVFLWTGPAEESSEPAPAKRTTKRVTHV